MSRAALLLVAVAVLSCGSNPASEMRAAMSLGALHDDVPLADSVTVHAMDPVGRAAEGGLLVLTAGDSLRLCAVRWYGGEPEPPTMFDTGSVWDTPHVTVLDYRPLDGGWTCAMLRVLEPAEEIEVRAYPHGTYPLDR